jgi:hypothetical protein
MPLPKLTIDDYIDELNRRLRRQPEFREGMRFERHPKLAVGKAVRSVTAEGADDMPGVFARVERELDGEFDIDVR